MRSMQRQLGILGTISAFAYRHRETKKNLCRGDRSQDLPNTDFQPTVRQLKNYRRVSRHSCQSTGWTSSELWVDTCTDRRCISSPNSPDRRWGPPSLLLFSGYQEALPMVVKRPVLISENSRTASTEVKSNQNCTSAPCICLYSLYRDTLADSIPDGVVGIFH